MFQLILYPLDQEVEVLIQLVETSQFGDKSKPKPSCKDDLKHLSMKNKTFERSNTTDKTIVDEMILTVQGETSFEFASIQSEASILSIEVHKY